MNKVREPRHSGTRHLAGLMTHLNFLASVYLGRSRPRATSVRIEQDIRDYVEDILQIRQQATEVGMHNYLEAEQALLRACKGMLPPTIRLRAQYAYRNLPSVKLLELLYAEPIADTPWARRPAQLLADYKEATGGGPLEFRERLKPQEQAQWDAFVARDEKNRAALEEQMRLSNEREGRS